MTAFKALVSILCLLVGLGVFDNKAIASLDFSNAPVAGVLSSPFGWRVDPMTGGNRFHGGVDIAAPYGSPVYLPQSGLVVFSGPYGGYGNVVVVQHSGNLYTLYGHNSYLLVSPGSRVSRGQMIAMVGSTGRSTGPHLHFEVRQGNQYVNPLDYLGYLNGTMPASLVQGVRPSASASQHLAKSTASPRPRKHTKRASWSVEVIQGSDVDVVEF